MTQFDENAKIDVFFVGVGKCGTSWIYKYLTRRGDVGVPKIKEPYILNHPPKAQSDKIRDLYNSLRPRCDFSNVYYWDTSVPEKIIAHNPDAKIVLTVRKPSKRVSSHFAFLQRNGEFPGSTLLEYLDSGDPVELVARSDYQAILDRFSAVIPKNRVLVLSLELLSDDPQEYADRLASFLDLPEKPLDENDEERVLGRSSARSPFVSRSAKRLAELLRRRGALEALSFFKESSLVRKLLFSERVAATTENVDEDQFPEALRHLDDRYEDFLRRYQITV